MSHCTWCSAGKRSVVVERIRREPHVEASVLASESGLTLDYVRHVRGESRQRGCLPPATCRCGTPTDKGGRCAPCQKRVHTHQLDAHMRWAYAGKHRAVRPWLLPPIGAAYQEGSMNCVGKEFTCELPGCGKTYVCGNAGGKQRRYCSRRCNEMAHRRGVAKPLGEALGPVRPLLWATPEEERARREKVAERLIREGVPLSAIEERMGFNPQHLIHRLGMGGTAVTYVLPYGPPL